MVTTWQSNERRHRTAGWVGRAIALSTLGMLLAQVVSASASNLTVRPTLVSTWTYEGAPALQTLLAEDNFSSNGTLVSATTGGPWTQLASRWIGGQSAQAADPGNSAAFVDLPGVVDGRMDISIAGLAGSHAGVMVRGNDTAGIFVVFEYPGPTSFPEVRLVVANDLVNGLGALPTPVAFAQVNATPNATMSVDVENGAVKVLWNGIAILSYTLTPTQVLDVSTPTSTGWGFWVEGGTSPLFDNFRIQGNVLP